MRDKTGWIQVAGGFITGAEEIIAGSGVEDIQATGDI